MVFCLSLVDCTSSVLYFPYMARFRETYMISFMIGEGCSGLIAALASLAQGVGGNPYCQNVTVFNQTTGHNETHIEKGWTKNNEILILASFIFNTRVSQIFKDFWTHCLLCST